LTVNELFLSKARQWWSTFQPMVVVGTSFDQGSTTVTVPAVVGPSLLARPGEKLPQGLLLNDIEVAGPIPYRGGALTITVLLYQVTHSNHARDLLQLVEGVSKAIGPAADLGLLSKVGGALLDGLGSLLGLDGTVPIMGQRFTMSPVGPGGMKTFYAALIGPAAQSLEGLSVDQGRLRLSNGTSAAPFTMDDYVLYSLSAAARRTDESTLPFYRLYERAIQDAFRGGDDNWKAAKATFSEVWQQMIVSPDLIPEQAEELFEAWKAKLLQEKQRGEATRLLSSGADGGPGVDARTRAAAAILDLPSGPPPSSKESRDTKSVPAEFYPVPGSSPREVPMRGEDDPICAVPDSERHVSIWISERTEDPVMKIRPGETCTLNFRVGEPVRTSLVDGPDTVIPAEDVPEHGLETEWVVTSEDVQLARSTPNTAVTEAVFEGRQVWTARFALLIPRSGDSATAQLMVTPRRAGEARLDVLINVRGEIYREFKVRLQVAVAIAPPAAARIVDDVVHTPVAHLGLQPPYEWTTPPGTLTLGVGERNVFVKGAAGPIDVDDQIPWDVVPARVSGRIENVRAAAERFRGDWGSYLDDIDPTDLASRLDKWSPDYDWTSLVDRSDARHRQQWDEVSVSEQLRTLAFEGRRLYDAFFPLGTPLRAWADALEPAYRLNISWTPRSGPAWIPHVPWGLMYVSDVPAVGQPVDPIGFLGLKLRIGYRAHDVQAASKGLGSLDATHRTHFLYWGSEPQDLVGHEARRQRTDWSRWPNQVFVPSAQPPADAKAELLRLMGSPQPAPTTVLYLFCHCNLGRGNDPVLRFGPTSDTADIIGRTDLATTPLDDRPFVFVNACATGAADAHMANELEAGFFDRGCRAFLGTETKVPIAFASRFATIFFRFFYRTFAPAPLAAGEAVAQTRLFLWTRYRNVGGLLYSYVNQYELFMAPDEEVRAMRL
jgi:hypothetical protein